MTDDFDPFCAYSFADSQNPEAKYGLGEAYLSYAKVQAAGHVENFTRMPDFDLRLTSARQHIAWWVTLTHRLRIEGMGLLVAQCQKGVFKDALSGLMCEELLKYPGWGFRFKSRIRPAFRKFFAEERRRMEQTCLLALEIYWESDESQSAQLNVFAPIHEGTFSERVDACASQTWRIQSDVEEELTQLTRTHLSELHRRFSAMEAVMLLWLDEDLNPSNALSRMNSFWVEPCFDSYREAVEEIGIDGWHKPS